MILGSSPIVDDEALSRYRKNYSFGDAITHDHVKKHWELETRLTKRLLSSKKEDRWEVFEQCYTELYSKLTWLNTTDKIVDFSHWKKLFRPDSYIFEVGSGGAGLVRYLASIGHRCVATEITRERGEKHSVSANIEWHQTDGVNLERFEHKNTYDYVISTQVIEHIHPEDISDHFENVHSILRSGGVYYYDTPHRGFGPADLSRVFNLDAPACMHLKEYTFVELGKVAKKSGFDSVGAILFFKRPFRIGPFQSKLYYRYCCAWDMLFNLLSLKHKTEKNLRYYLRLILVPQNIWMYARKKP